MRNLLRCRRGTAAFVTVVALVPLIGVVALGGEAGSWYVTKQHAQNGADSAAMSSAMAIANSNSQPNFGTLNGFPSNVTVTQGSYSTGSGYLSGGAPVNAVQATVTQCQPQALSLVLFSTNCTDASGSHTKSVKITAQAVATVQKRANPCVLALGGPITFQDNGVDINAPTCGLASNYAGPGPSIDFGPVKPSNIQIGPGVARGGCSGNDALCKNVSTYAPPVTNPYTGLEAAISALTLRACTGADGTPPVAYTATHNCANKDYSINGSGNSATLTGGTYFFSGDFTMKGNGGGLTTIGATIILLPGINTGKSNHVNMTLQAPNTTPTALPASLQPYAALIGATAIYNTQTDAQKFTGQTNIALKNGIMYYPYQSLTFSGNSTIDLNGCSELIAKSVKFAGSVNFTQQGCPDTAKMIANVVTLVQ